MRQLFAIFLLLPALALGQTDEQCFTYEATGTTVEWQACGGAASMPPKLYYWPGSALEAAEPGDSIAPVGKAAGTNIDFLYASYDDTTDECRTARLQVPADVDTTASATFRAVYSAATTPGSCASDCTTYWDFRHAPIDNDEATDTALTTEADGGCDVNTVAGDEFHCEWTETLTNLGWVADDEVYFMVCRDANHASDDLTGDARLHSFSVEIPQA